MVAAGYLLLALAQATWAWNAPERPGSRIVWQDNFVGRGGSLPDPNNWSIRTNIRVNNELQEYTTSTQNLQRSGGETFQIIPRREGGRWTSGRIESRYVFTPQHGSITVAQAEIRFGANDAQHKQGYWPAFWMLGDSMRRGTDWPGCGEIDIFESLNGRPEGFGTVHCDVYPGGICNEPNGRGATVSIPDQGWHTWDVSWDRQDGDWRNQSISWHRDGEMFHQVTGDSIGSEGIWATLAHSPMYFLLNMAIGGDLPGNPNENTRDGFGSMMEVAYVAHYAT